MQGSSSSSVAAELTVRATNSGIFTVVVGDFSSFYAGSGSYRLTLLKLPGAVYVSPGDEGGAMMGNNAYEGTLATGDLDIFTFTACSGEPIDLRMDEQVDGSTLTPWLRLYGRDGTLIRSSFGAATAQISAVATNSGTFTVVAGDDSNFYAGSGTYRLLVNGLTTSMRLCDPVIVNPNVRVIGIGGPPGATVVVHSHTNVIASAEVWPPIHTNVFDSFGVFTVTNTFNRNEPGRFYLFHLQ